MKASELKQGETYGTVWGFDVEYLGTKKFNDYNEYTGEPTSDIRYEFKCEDGGRSYLTEENVEKFVSNGTVEISTRRLNEIMKGAQKLDDQVAEAFREVKKLTDAIEAMKYDCDAEVYDGLCKLFDILGR